MKKLGCIRCTTGAPASSIIATSTPSPEQPNEYVDRLMFCLPFDALARIRLYASVLPLQRPARFLHVHRQFQAFGYRGEFPSAVAEAWAKAALNLYEEILPRADADFALLSEYWDAEDIRAQHRDAMFGTLAPPSNPFANLRTTRVRRTPTPKEAVCPTF